ncbi:MAG: carboxypeptidase regulatory-like domain-containing protein [Pyrinomonadaceae bacterium]
MKKLVALILNSLFLAVTSLCFVGHAVGQSAIDGFAPIMPGSSEGGAGFAVAVQRDGKVLFGGGFVESATSRRGLTRLLPDGFLDPPFNANVAGVGNAAAVYAVAIQPGATPADDKILIGGNFSNPRSWMARLNLDGSLDTLFSPFITGGPVTDIVVQPADGKILICGLFTSVEGLPRNGIARLNPNGSVDTAFDPNPTGSVKAIKLQKNSQILVGGSFTNIGGQSRNNIARLEINGNADTTFNPNANGSVTAIETLASSDIVIGGDFTTVGSTPRDKVARLFSSGPSIGTVDPSFTPPSIAGDISNTGIFSLVVQGDGRVIVGGDFLTVGGVPQRSIARLSRDGSHDATYNPVLAGGNFRTQVYGIALQPDGKAVITGDFFTVNAVSRLNGARLERNGALDQTIPNFMNTPGAVRAIATQPDGKVLIGGTFSTFFGQNNLVRLNTDGNGDFPFDPIVNGNIEAIVIQPADGKIIIGGDFTMVNSQSCNRIARLNSTGTFDSCLNSGADDTVFALALQTDDSILVGGNFFTIGGVTRRGIARLNPDGTVDSFDPDTGGSGGVSAIAVQPADDKILVGGNFSFIGGQDRLSIARLNTDGTADSFDPSSNGVVEDIAIVGSGKVMIAGSFTTLTPNGGATITRRRMARLNADGTVDAAFLDPNANDTVFSIAAQANGRILAGGRFTSIGGQPRNRIARIRPDGTADPYDANANDEVLSLAIQSDGKALVGGRFTQIGGQTRNSFARLSYLDTLAVRRVGWSFLAVFKKIGESAPLYTYVCFEQSIDDGVTWTSLGCGYVPSSPLSGLTSDKTPGKAELGLPPEEVEYQLTGLNLPVGQNFLIRASAYSGSSGLAEQDVWEAFVLAPTAAAVSITGRVTTSNGQGIRNARLTLTAPDGTRRTAITSTFGYYAFDGVEVGQTYVLEIASKRYTFENATRVFSLQDKLTDVDFTAMPQ